MPSGVPSPPAHFNLTPHANRWFAWAEVHRCFWPKSFGFRRSADVHPVLAPMVRQGGVYLLAWALEAPTSVHPTTAEVCYIGETGSFKARMGGFGNSAGLWDTPRAFGHSAGWRWPEGGKKHLWVAFCKVDWPLAQAHLATGMRMWMEAVALEEHRQANGSLPRVNRDKTKHTSMPFILECKGIGGVAGRYYVEGRDDASVPDEWRYAVHLRWPANEGNDDFFEFAVRADANGGIRVTTMEHHGRAHYSAKGIPDALLVFAAKHLNKVVGSSSNLAGSDEFRTPAATKVWDRLVARGTAVYDAAADRYTLHTP